LKGGSKVCNKNLLLEGRDMSFGYLYDFRS